ncbi:uncharacterized protein LOC123704569 isoform X1 [Colias croceus]|uniref:uncharacterized protein LOC123704569 isoform X1 n=1 Tax=Colias crocea TaxID=72248 RepID=UPI001E27E332|nr:uncharacterized protein LOC123704569 isoform X1 [Colias croceus]
MASRGRGMSLKDWDPMRDDFNDSTYDAQYADDNIDSGVQLDHNRLYVSNIPQTLSEEGLKMVFIKYGTIVKLFMSKDPKKRYAMITYESPSEAKLAMMKLNKSEPLKLNVSISHKKKNHDYDEKERSNPRSNTTWNRAYKDESSSVSSKGNYQKQETTSEYDDESISEGIDSELHLELEQLKLEHLRLQEEQLQCKQRILLLNRVGKTPNNLMSNRIVTADGKIVIKTTSDRSVDLPADATLSGAGDSKDACSCEAKTWIDRDSEDSSTPSTCVQYSGDRSIMDKVTDLTIFDKSDFISDKIVKAVDFIHKTRPKSRCTISRKSDVSRFTGSKSDVTSKRCKVAKKSEISCDFKCDCDESEDEDETNRLIQLRNADYMDIVEENLKIVIALAGYPKSKMRLRQMEIFQRSINDIMDMQLKAGLMKKSPSFIDYYLNRGAIVCICKDAETRDWMVRISPGLQERMSNNLLLLKAKVRRLCIGVTKIPQTCWPTSAQDAFKLLQYFNPSLNTYLWKIYAQKIINNVECSSFLIDRISGEIIRGPSFKNIIDYSQMEFEITGYTEIYYDCFLSDMAEDVHSVASRVKLLEEIRSNENTPRIESTKKEDKICETDKKIENTEAVNENVVDNERVDSAIEMEEEDAVIISDSKDFVPLEEQKEGKDNNKDDTQITPWATEHNSAEEIKSDVKAIESVEQYEPSTSTVAISDKTESLFESSDNLIISRNSNYNIDSNRGIAYHRRTNYLHVENELKIAITLEGYPQDKLEGNHIRRLKHLFKEYLHKDMKVHRFDNMIIPKFQDVYLSNGAVIYVCDSLETKDYLIEVLPKFINSTGLKLTFREVQKLVRYTRLVMRLPKELAHLESAKILLKLKTRYPKLKPDCWKYYSDIAGKQKRQFGVDPESLEVIKSPDFDPTYEGQTLAFRIIDRQKRDVSFEEPTKDSKVNAEDLESIKIKENIIKNMYSPLDPDISNAPLTRIRANHYADFVPDDLKLYVGPSNYPETRIDDVLFQTIKRSIENVYVEINDEPADFPIIHDMYLFDGVIFIICKNMSSRLWIENSLPIVNERVKINLKATEFRGAVGIVSMFLNSGKNPDDVIAILQTQNSRLRTKYWRKINVERSQNKLEVVLQIDKLSAQVILGRNFNGNIDNNEVTFKLGHLKSLINRKLCLDTAKTPSDKTLVNTKSKPVCKPKNTDSETYKILQKPKLKRDKNSQTDARKSPVKNTTEDKDETDKEYEDAAMKTRDTEIFYSTHVEFKSDSDKSAYTLPITSKHSYCKITLKIPTSILPDTKEALDMIFDLLQDKNPGLNTELWKVNTPFNNKGVFDVLIDKQSASVIRNKDFDPSLGGEKLRFIF